MVKRSSNSAGVIATLYTLLYFLVPVFSYAESPSTLSNIVISELQTATAASASQEFVELYNTTNAAINLSDWKLEYKSATGTSWSAKSTLSGTIQPRGFYLVATDGYFTEANDILSSGLAASGGHVRISQPDGTVTDLVGWGTADSPESSPAPAPVTDASITRSFNTAGQIADTNNNATDFTSTDSPTPTSTPADETDSPDSPGDTPSSPSASCEGVIITEILPNPAGTDSGSEFIELHNPSTDFVPMEDCGLQVGSSSKIYRFASGTELEPGVYQAFYDGQTGLTLPNAAGGTVYLLSANDQELGAVTYRADMEDDTSWALFNGGWSVTYAITPNAANILQATKPCPAGQERSLETGRCQNTISEASGLTPCRADQERNPETNRCRTIATPNQLAPCQPGQERNPDTNRCRKIGSTTSSTLKPCQPGQERNPATNRCRTIQAAKKSNSKNGSDTLGAATPSTIPNSSLTTGVVATAAGLALLYGAYEYRYDLRNKFELIRRYFTHRWHSGP